MKSTLSMLALAATLVTSGAVLAAGDGQPVLPEVEAQQRQAQLASLPEPAAFSDDICWVAPEWRDS
jgi:hypothetical protein